MFYCNWGNCKSKMPILDHVSCPFCMINAAVLFEQAALDIFSSLSDNKTELKMSMIGGVPCGFAIAGILSRGSQSGEYYQSGGAAACHPAHRQLMPRREIVQDNIAGWFGVDRSQLNIFAGQTLINNSVLLVEAGLGYAVCVGGVFEIRGGENLHFVPFAPERTTGHMFVWKKNRVFHAAAGQFREFVRETKAL